MPTMMRNSRLRSLNTRPSCRAAPDQQKPGSIMHYTRLSKTQTTSRKGEACKDSSPDRDAYQSIDTSGQRSEQLRKRKRGTPSEHDSGSEHYQYKEPRLERPNFEASKANEQYSSAGSDSENVGNSQDLPTPSMTPIKKTCKERPLPDTLNQIVHLNASFLRALSLHFAHNGTVSPVPVEQLLASASRIWGKRAVTVEDLRRCLGIIEQFSRTTKDDKVCDLHLYDYGNGLLRLEKETVFQRQNPGGALQRPIDEEKLNDIFVSNLTKLWNNHDRGEKPEEGSTAAEDVSITSLISNLPLCPIQPHPSLKHTQSTISLGQQRLLSLTPKHNKPPRDPKTNFLTPSSTHSSTTSTHSQNPPSSSKKSSTELTSRKTSLLSRLKAKEEKALTLSNTHSNPTHPTEQDLLRKAALQKLPEITTILSSTIISTNTGRQTFNLLSLTQKIKQSMRSVMSDVEIKRVLEIMSDATERREMELKGKLGGREGEGEGVESELEEETKKGGIKESITPVQGFLKIVKIGRGVVGVVVNGCCRPVLDNVEKWVREEVRIYDR